RITARYSGAADDLRLADEMLAQARTKQLPSTRTEIGAGGELIDREKVGSHLFDTVAHPDYVTAEASRDRLGLANQAGSLRLALVPTLLAGVRPELDPILLSDDEPALCQIARLVRRGARLDAIHVIAHGRVGEVSFGAGAVSLESLAGHTAELRAIGQA